MEELQVFPLSQIAQHKSKNDCWLVINGKVLDVTRFLEEHPGGEEVLIESSGKDASKEFTDIGHSKAAQNLILKYQVGIVQGYNSQEVEAKDDASVYQEPKRNEMEAFVIKGDHKPKHAALLEFFVPLLVVCSYFAYRYLTKTHEIVS